MPPDAETITAAARAAETVAKPGVKDTLVTLAALAFAGALVWHTIKTTDAMTAAVQSMATDLHELRSGFERAGIKVTHRTEAREDSQ